MGWLLDRERQRAKYSTPDLSGKKEENHFSLLFRRNTCLAGNEKKHLILIFNVGVLLKTLMLKLDLSNYFNHEGI